MYAPFDFEFSQMCSWQCARGLWGMLSPRFRRFVFAEILGQKAVCSSFSCILPVTEERGGFFRAFVEVVEYVSRMIGVGGESVPFSGDRPEPHFARDSFLDLGGGMGTFMNASFFGDPSSPRVVPFTLPAGLTPLFSFPAAAGGLATDDCNDSAVPPLDRHFMGIALALAAAAEGQTAPNPNVGCVLVREGRIVGFGAHLQTGQPHAEVHALRMAGEAARGATCYVTLEPCSHWGRTPPCAEALREAGVRRVVIALRDPNPRVAGRGIRILREAGVEVQEGVCAGAAHRVHAAYLTRVACGRPWVTVKVAMTLDGKIATRTGESRTITSEEALRAVHYLRLRHDAVLVGANTVRRDNPRLTVRLAGEGEEIGKLRIVLSRSLILPADASLFHDGLAPTLVATGSQGDSEAEARFRSLGVEVVRFPTAGVEREIDLAALLALLAERGVNALLVEGGGETIARFVSHRLVDRFVVFVAPRLLGGREAPGWLAGEGVATLPEGISLIWEAAARLGEDFVLVGRPLADGMGQEQGAK